MSQSAPNSDAGQSPKAFMGTFIILTYITLPLYGISLSQLYGYLCKFYKRDGWYVRANVALVMTIETLHSVVLMHCIYHYTITSALDQDMLYRITWSFPIIAISETLMTDLAHLFYIWRLYILSKRNMWLVSAFVILVVVRTSFSVFVTVFFALEDTFEGFHSNPTVKVKYTLPPSLAGTNLSPPSRTVHHPNQPLDARCSRLFHGRRHGVLSLSESDRSEHQVTFWCLRASLSVVQVDPLSAPVLVLVLNRSDNIVNTLTLYVVNTGLITAIFSAAAIISFAFTEGLGFVGPVVITTKLYANAVLGSLNMRTYLQVRHEQVGTNSPLRPGTFRVAQLGGARLVVTPT
ncbi:hypothetical protein BXZ70DRAFT_1011416 [Cristinia sonorae]|uniref:DUF6534 domain-containing protein n=1 Tax=Cristinia sonorae TaxID=1940300 RepID=A0A8K0UHG2_9AGAR|nr:hypothetical protein BXZ70DRAFT_1011416 [Cristinia sonorae]